MDDTFVFVIVTGAVFWVLTVLALLDVILKDFGSLKNKVLWFVVAFIPFVGWLIYLVFGFRKGTRKTFL